MHPWPGAAYPPQEVLERYATLGFPFTEKRLYAPTYSLGPIAERVIEFLKDTGDENAAVQRGIEIRDELESYRGLNPAPWAIQNIHALQEARPNLDASRLIACLYTAEKLGVTAPMDVFIEYCRLCIDPEQFVRIGGMGLLSLSKRCTDEEQVMFLPGAAAILHGGEDSIAELQRIASSPEEDGGIRLQAIAFLQEMAPDTVQSIRETLAGEGREDLKADIDFLLSSGPGFGWRDAAGGVGSMQRRIERINAVQDVMMRDTRRN